MLVVVESSAPGLKNPIGDSAMYLHQAMSRRFRSPSQATIRAGGEQGREVVSDYFLAGTAARGLSCKDAQRRF